MSFSYVTISLFLIAFLFPDITNAQGIDVGIVAPGTQFCLQLENKTTHKVIFLVEGEILGYKLRSAKRFVSGRITAITDTTITLEDRETGSNTLSLKELTALKVQKSSRKKTLGNILIVVGAWILVFIPACQELSTAIFLTGPNTRVMSIVMLDFSEEGRLEQLSVLGGVLLVITIAIVLLGFRIVGRDFMVRRA